MILTIKFLNNQNQKLNFNWELVNKPYSQRWVELMSDWKNHWNDGNPTFKDKWFLSSSNQDFLEYIQKIKEQVERIDAIGEHYVGSDNIHENITRIELNRIHKEFHKYIEKVKGISNKTDKEIETAELCHQLNDLVHLTEIAEKNRFESDPDKRIIATSRPHMQVDYDTVDYDSYVATMCKGWIYVGYATPGKSLFHCFLDNDFEVIKDGLVRQSQGLSNELHIELCGKKDIDLDYESIIKDFYYNWCEENKVKEFGYNYTESIYNPGRIPLARPIDDVDKLLNFFNSAQGKILDITFREYI